MESPWRVHGESMESPWRVHGGPMEGSWSPWRVHGESMESPWRVHEQSTLHVLSMDSPWTLMDSPWILHVPTHGLSMGSSWTLHVFGMESPWTCHGLSIWILNMKSPYGLSMWTLHMDPPWTLHGPSSKNEAHRGILAGRAGTPSMEGAHGHSCARIPGKTLPEQGMGHAFWPQSPPPTVLAVSRAVFWVNIKYYFRRNPG